MSLLMGVIDAWVVKMKIAEVSSSKALKKNVEFSMS